MESSAMSFSEILENVKLLTLDEQWQLHQAVTAEINKANVSLLDWFKPGMVGYMTPEMKVDEWVLQKMLEPSSMTECSK